MVVDSCIDVLVGVDVGFGVAVAVATEVGVGVLAGATVAVGVTVGGGGGVSVAVGVTVGVGVREMPPATAIVASVVVQSISVQVRGGCVPQGSLSRQPNGMEGVSLKLRALTPLATPWKVIAATNPPLCAGVAQLNVMVTRPETLKSTCPLQPLSPEGVDSDANCAAVMLTTAGL